MIAFSSTGYAELIAYAKDRAYRFIGFDSIGEQSTHALLLRHDIDFSMEYAHAMARMEADAGVNSTYFVMLRSPVYSLFSRRSSMLLRDIVAMGHGIGLHFDAAFHQGSERSETEWLQFEIATLATLANTPISAFSLHQPSQVLIDQRLALEGMINTYHPDHLAGFSYISDSNRDWRGKDPLAMLDTGGNLQLLIHPMWWISPATTTEACWDEVIALNFMQAQEQILATERAYGPKRTLTLSRSS